MTTACYIAAAIALLATGAVLFSRNTVHGLLYLVVSLFAVAVLFYTIGAPLAAALEIIIYAGAIMVLFIFVVMMLNLGERSERRERQWLQPHTWLGPAVLSAVLLAELVYVIGALPAGTAGALVGARLVGASTFGPYVLAVELAGMLLLAALVGALHLGQQPREGEASSHG